MVGEADGCIIVINLKVTSNQKALETSGSKEGPCMGEYGWKSVGRKKRRRRKRRRRSGGTV
jgi:hypothetical protein